MNPGDTGGICCCIANALPVRIVVLSEMRARLARPHSHVVRSFISPCTFPAVNRCQRRPRQVTVNRDVVRGARALQLARAESRQPAARQARAQILGGSL